MLYAFDLDGTLIDSEQVVLSAYREVGVEPPADFFTRSWREWLNDEKLHNDKNRVYLTKLHLIEPLPLMRLYKDLWRWRPAILTGASSVPVDVIADMFDLKRKDIYTEMSIADKIAMMNRQPYKGIMFEDQLTAAKRMRRQTKWTICHT
jgi:hypothetical protein